MRMWRLALAAIVLGCVTLPANAQELGIGSDAPKLAIKEFVKGDPVKQLDKGKIHVVEFWATWCGPCIRVFPHLSELQKKHKDVIFIGCSVFERDQELVKPFVEKQAANMQYRVCMDTADGTMAKTWMTAAAQNGIPTAFIVNGDGKVAWIGHPQEMDKPLADIVAGNYDLKTAAAEFKEKAANQKKLTELSTKLRAAQQSGDMKQAVKVLDDAITENPKLEKTIGSTKFRLMQQAGEADKTLSYGQHLVEKVYKDEPQQLNQIAWNLIDPAGRGPKADAKLKKLALQAALRADELKEKKDAAIADTLALAYFENGDAPKALETQERVMKLAKGTELEKDAEVTGRLEQYRKAVEKK